MFLISVIIMPNEVRHILKMVKIKKFKIKVSPFEVFKSRKKEEKDLKWSKELKKEIEKEIESKIGYLDPKVVYETFKGEETKEIFSQNAPAISFACITIGDPDRMPLEYKKESKTQAINQNKTSILRGENVIFEKRDTAIFEVALSSAAKFTQKLIKEEAEGEKFNLSEGFLPGKEVSGKIPQLLNADKIGVKIDENGNIYPPWSKILVYQWEK